MAPGALEAGRSGNVGILPSAALLEIRVSSPRSSLTAHRVASGCLDEDHGHPGADLAKKVKTLAHRRGLLFKQALNEVIRRGLTSPDRQDAQARFTLQPHAGGFRPGIDPGKLNQLVAARGSSWQLEVEDFIAKAQR